MILNGTYSFLYRDFVDSTTVKIIIRLIISRLLAHTCVQYQKILKYIHRFLKFFNFENSLEVLKYSLKILKDLGRFLKVSKDSLKILKDFQRFPKDFQRCFKNLPVKIGMATLLSLFSETKKWRHPHWLNVQVQLTGDMLKDGSVKRAVVHLPPFFPAVGLDDDRSSVNSPESIISFLLLVPYRPTVLFFFLFTNT